MKELTKKQRDILIFVKNYIRYNKYPPSIRDIGDNFGITVKGAYDHFKAIEKKGYIKRNSKARSIVILNKAS